MTIPINNAISADDNVLILGIGNLLWADEGFGVRCVEALAAAWELPATVTVMDGGTQGLYLLPYVSAARRLIVFDAIDYGIAPGTLEVVENDEVPRFMGVKKMSLHQTGFQEVISSAALLGRVPTEMVLIGVQAEELEDFGGSLRPVVRARVGEAVALAIARLQQWGFEPVRRASSATSASAPALDITAYEAGRPAAELACRTGDSRFFTAGH
ncbi:hydrogenase expression/formation protein [Betaproteobacteria bacterium]|nr:hydrogenase expression/formation protein [Betaproteobacteria bacterium]